MPQVNLHLKERSTRLFALLTILGVALYVVGYVVYYRQFRQYTSSPRIATWLQWAILSTLNALSYHSMCDGDWVKTAQSFAGCLGNIFIFVVVLKRNKFNGIWDDIRWVVVGMILAILWRITHNPFLVNLLLQACLVVSTIPTVKAVWKNPDSEKWPAWMIIGTSFIFMLVVAILKMESFYAILYPVNALATNFTIGFLSLRKVKVPI